MIHIYSPSIHIDSGDDDKYSGGFFNKFRSKISTPQNFVSRVRHDLKIIGSKPVGADLLDLIAKRNLGVGTKLKADGNGKKVKICNGWGTLTKNNTFASASNVMGRYSGPQELRKLGYKMMLAGKGTDVVVSYNPDLDHSRLLKLKTPSFIALAHELVHAWHWMGGNMDGRDSETDPISGMINFMIKEEAFTVGAGTYENTRISENAIRKEHGLPLREFYRVPGDCLLGGRNRSSALAR